MIGLQRIWMLCLLVIAGSGPLPLWLHHAVCHGPASHGPACQGHAHPAPVSLVAIGHAKSGEPACCGHSHRHQTAAPATAFASKAARPAGSWQAVNDSHEDCAACYTLSQLTTAQPTHEVLVSLLCSQYVCPAGDSQASLQTWLAYSSRGPPAV